MSKPTALSVTEQLKRCRERNRMLQEDNRVLKATNTRLSAGLRVGDREELARYQATFNEALSVLVKRGYRAEVARLRTMVEAQTGG